MYKTRLCPKTQSFLLQDSVTLFLRTIIPYFITFEYICFMGITPHCRITTHFTLAIVDIYHPPCNALAVVVSSRRTKGWSVTCQRRSFAKRSWALQFHTSILPFWCYPWNPHQCQHPARTRSVQHHHNCSMDWSIHPPPNHQSNPVWPHLPLMERRCSPKWTAMSSRVYFQGWCLTKACS